MSIKTSNYYQSAVKEFCSWMVRDKRAGESPVGHLQALNADVDKRRDRRPLLPEEFEHLLTAAASGPSIESIPGEDRAMLYVVAAWTGYRRKELASITLLSFDFEADPATLTVVAGYSKRRRKDTIPLHPEVVKRLRSWLQTKEGIAPTDPLFPVAERKTAKMMRLDLARARAAWLEEAATKDDRAQREASDFLLYRDSRGRYADFHANRHTFISNLGKAGVAPKTAQTLARHSDINLTMNVYSHVELLDQAQAIGVLPMPPGSEADSSIVQDDSQKLTPTADFWCPQVTMVGIGLPECEPIPSSPNPLTDKPLGNDCHQEAVNVISSGGGTRTPDTRIMIQGATTENTEENWDSQSGAAAGAAVDAELQVVVDSWAFLPCTIRAGICAIIRATTA